MWMAWKRLKTFKTHKKYNGWYFRCPRTTHMEKGSLPQRRCNHSHHWLQHNNTQQAQQGEKTQKVESGGIQTQASKVVPLGLKRGRLGGSYRTLQQKSVVSSQPNLLKTQSPGFSLEAGHMGTLCLCDKPQLPKFQTPSRKAGVHQDTPSVQLI